MFGNIIDSSQVRVLRGGSSRSVLVAPVAPLKIQ
jgi:hypothetical protein